MNRLKIGYRTIKTAIGTAAAIIISQFFELDYASSAGILTILCIQNSKKKSFQTAYERFSACMIGMGFSYLFLEGIAYHPVVIGILLLFFIPVTVYFKITDGVVTSAVIILHIYMEQKLTMALVMNEMGLIVIGIGVALLVNLYMPSLDAKLNQYQMEIEKNFRIIFEEMVSFLRTNESRWMGQEITETARLLDEATSLAFRDVENQFLRSENYYYHYFLKRGKQFEIIERVLPIVTSIELHVSQRYLIADFLEDLSKTIQPVNVSQTLLTRLHELQDQLREQPLPASRDEFEARARLFQFVIEIEQYLLVFSQLK